MPVLEFPTDGGRRVKGSCGPLVASAGRNIPTRNASFAGCKTPQCIRTIRPALRPRGEDLAVGPAPSSNLAKKLSIGALSQQFPRRPHAAGHIPAGQEALVVLAGVLAPRSKWATSPDAGQPTSQGHLPGRRRPSRPAVRSPIDQPTISLRDYRSSTAARYSQPSPVAMYVMIAVQVRSAAAGRNSCSRSRPAVMVRVGGAPELPLRLRGDPVLAHQLGHGIHAACLEARLARRGLAGCRNALHLGVDASSVLATTRASRLLRSIALRPSPPVVIAAGRNVGPGIVGPAIDTPVAFDEVVPHDDSLAKKAVAFFQDFASASRTILKKPPSSPTV